MTELRHLETKTEIRDEQNHALLLQADGPLWLPVGAEIELSGRVLVVTSVR